MRTGTKEKCFHLNECRKSKTTIENYNKVHMAVAHYECNESGNNFSSISSLTQSQRTATEQTSFASNKCDENLSQSSAHIVQKKTQTRDEFCVYNGCINTFYQKLDLIVCQRTHTEEELYQQKSFECNECKKSFYQKVQLIHHQRTHPGERPEECGESFCSNSHPIHYPGTDIGVSLYGCSKCEKTFCQKLNLSENLTVHTKETPYDNSGCGKSYKKSALVVCQRTHTGMKLCQSNVYGKTFSKTSHIREHQRIHTREKSYKCIEYDSVMVGQNPMNINVRKTYKIQPV
uniref:C2H2-type domain-containing protein n=1 Tax=Panthera leo TaxID=9689 RepID=A0A8C8Y3W2_PANLE